MTMLSKAQESPTYADYPISAVSIKNVILKDGFWLPKIAMMQDVTIRYAFEKCDTEGRMENFLVAGGKKKGVYRGKMPFDDTDLYKIIEGASYSLISRPNPSLDAYIDSLISIIAIGQEPDGYLTTWFTIDREKPPAWWVKPSKSRWQNEVSSHELYNSGHLFEAAAAHYSATGKTSLLDIAVKNADLLVVNFEPDKLRTPPGHQIVETGLIKLYHITHNAHYLELAKFFLDVRGDSTTHKLYGEYSQDHLPVIRQTEATGHAVRALYMYAGMTDIAAIYKNQEYFDAANKIWENIVSKKMYITGGLGSRRDNEAFGDDYELPNLTAYNETCAAVGSVLWNQRLFLLSGNSKYYDVIERTLYNGLISGISLDGKEFFYPNPAESDGTFKFNMGSCTRQAWFDCSCCPTNLIRFLPSIPGLIYAVDKESLYVNLFISNRAEVHVAGQAIEVTQQTEYPWNGRILISVNPETKKAFVLKLRLPGWAQGMTVPSGLYSYSDGHSSKINILVNGRKENISLDKGYVVISREWNKGDLVDLDLPMTIHQVTANENVRDDSNKAAIEYGPFVYCAEECDNKQFSEISLSRSIQLTVEEGTVLAEKVITVKGKVHNEEFTLIPYYAWSNRGVGKMKVWFPRSTN